MVTVLLALAAAFGFAMASAGQQHVASSVPSQHSLRLGLLVRLGTNWRWLAATALDLLAFVCEAAALHVGSLVVVQAILPSSLLFALPVSAALIGRRLIGTEWLAATSVAGGIAAFLVAAAPQAGRSQAPTSVWLTLIVVVVTVVSALTILGVHAESSAMKAGGWAAAGALTYAFMATMTKSTTDLFDRGFRIVATSWQPYALALSAVAGTLLIQSAFQAGSLGASMPLMVMVEPISGVLIGSTVFQEHLNAAPFHIVAMMTALTLMAFGVLTLSRSPLARYLA